jgi:hypothetical protein
VKRSSGGKIIAVSAFCLVQEKERSNYFNGGELNKLPEVTSCSTAILIRISKKARRGAISRANWVSVFQLRVASAICYTGTAICVEIPPNTD